jgi:Carbohydrate-selective porin, OprB family
MGGHLFGSGDVKGRSSKLLRVRFRIVIPARAGIQSKAHLHMDSRSRYRVSQATPYVLAGNDKPCHSRESGNPGAVAARAEQTGNAELKLIRAGCVLAPGRPNDKVGIAAAIAQVGDNARGLDADIELFGNPQHPVRSSEAMIEMTYQAQINPWLMVQPDLQYIINPDGGVLNPDGSPRRNAWAIGVRSLIKF